MNWFGLTDAEVVPYLGILIMVSLMFLLSYRMSFHGMWSPLSIIAVIFAYYCLLGPYQAIISDDTKDRLMNMRVFYPSAFWGAFVFLISVVAGFLLYRKRGKPMLPPSVNIDTLLSYYGRALTLTGFILFTIATRGNVANLINPLDADAVPDLAGGGLANYLNLSLNFLIPGVTLLFAYFVRTGKGIWWFAAFCIIALGLFTTLGFRYRIVLLVGALASTYYLGIRRRPNLIFAGGAIFLFISLMGIINLTRNYGGGLNLSKLDEEKDSQAYYKSGLREAFIFQTSGAVIDLVPERYDYVGFQPIVSTLVFPVPSAFYPEKNSGKYLFDLLDVIYGKKYSKGAAMMSYAEYYMTFGWIGIIGGGLLIGWFSKKLWMWYLANHHNPFVIVAYSVTVVYLYVVLSRGYLPQVTMLFFFSVFPIYVVLRLMKRRVRSFYVRSRSSVRQVEPAH
jgi:oligosaccharide repeat unit polymerase